MFYFLKKTKKNKKLYAKEIHDSIVSHDHENKQWWTRPKIKQNLEWKDNVGWNNKHFTIDNLRVARLAQQTKPFTQSDQDSQYDTTM